MEIENIIENMSEADIAKYYDNYVLSNNLFKAESCYWCSTGYGRYCYWYGNTPCNYSEYSAIYGEMGYTHCESLEVDSTCYIDVRRVNYSVLGNTYGGIGRVVR